MSFPTRFLRFSFLCLLAACGESVVGRSPDANTPPTVDPIANQTTDEDTPVSFGVTLADAESVDVLTITGDSDVATLVDASSFTFSGTGANRTVTITPKPDANGTATVTLTVHDSDAYVAPVTVSFTLTVNAIDDAPVISAVANQTIDEDGTTGPLAFTVTDVDTALANVIVTATSSDTTLVPTVALTPGATAGAYVVQVTPVANASGTTTITLSAADATSNVTSTFVVTVNAVNDLPTITPISDQTVVEDGSISGIAFTVGDVETATTSLVVTATSSDSSIVTASTGLVLSGSGASRTLDVTPVADAFGTATITLTVSDGTATSTTSFVLTVTPINDPPVISPIANLLIEEDTSTAPIAFSVTDVDNTPAELTIVGASLLPSVVPDANVVVSGTYPSFTVVVTPLPQSNTGATTPPYATIEIRVSDGAANVTEAFDLTVAPLNDAPVMQPIAMQTTLEDTTLSGIVLDVTDIDTTPIDVVTTVATSSDPSIVANAGIVVSGSGNTRTISITPMPNATGTVTITIAAFDGVDTSTTSFDLVVTAVDDPPTISAIAPQSIPEDGTMGPVAFTIADVDTPLASLIVTTASSNPTLLPDAALTLGGTRPAMTLIAQPVANGFGTSSITITVADATTPTSLTFVLNVTSVNDLPTISAIGAQSTNEDTATGSIAFTVADVETDPCALVLAGTSDVPATVGPSSFAFGGSCGSRSVVVTPLTNANGMVSARITVTDADGGQATSIFPLDVLPVNDPPVISAIANQTMLEDGTLVLNVTVTDPDDASPTLTASSGNLSVIAGSGLVVSGTGTNRTLTITPVAEQSSTTPITITLTANDGSGPQTISFDVLVQGVDDPPTITPISDVTIAEDGNTGALSFTIADIDTPIATVVASLVRTSSNLTLAPLTNVVLAGAGATQTVTVTPVANGFGTTTIGLTVTDGTTPVTESFVVNVTSVNDLPVITGLVDRTVLEDGAVGPYTFTVSDVETPLCSLTVTGASSNAGLAGSGGISFGANAGCDSQTVSATLVANANGTTTITVTVTDADGGVATQSFVLTVTAVNDPPVPTAASTNTTGNVSVNGGTLAATDPDSAVLTFGPASGASTAGGIVTVSATGTFVYTPAPGFLGSDTFSFTVNDGSGPVTGTYTVNVGTPIRWFVDNAATSPGTNAGGTGGTDLHPFATLIEVESAPTTTGGDLVIVAYGNGTSVGYDQGFAMVDNMQLLGVLGGAGGTQRPKLAGTATKAAVVAANHATVQRVDIVGGVTGIAALGINGTLFVTDVDINGANSGIVATRAASGTTSASVGLTDVVVQGSTVFGARLDRVTLTTSGVNTVQAASGTALEATSSSFGSGVSFGLVGLVGATGTGLHLDGCSGLMTLGTIDVRLTAVGRGVVVVDSAVNLGSAGRIHTAAGSGIDVSSATANGASIGGTITDFDCVATDARCISLVNVQSTLALTQAFAARTQASAANRDAISQTVYVDTVSGTLTIDTYDASLMPPRASGTLQATGATALSMATLGTAAIRIASVTDTYAGPAISLATVGGSVLVTGDGTKTENASGGTIVSSGGDAIDLNVVASATLQGIDLTSAGTRGVRIRGATTAVFEGATIDGPSGAGNTAVGIGTSTSNVTFRTSTITSAERLIDIAESTAGSSTLTLENVDLSAAVNRCINAVTSAARNFTLTYAGGSATDCGTAQPAMQVGDTGTGTLTLDVTNVDFSLAALGIVASTSGAGIKTLEIDQSIFDRSTGDQVAWNSTNCAARNRFAVTNTRFGTSSTSSTPSTTTGSAIRIGVVGQTGCSVSHRLESNQIYGIAALNEAGVRTSYQLASGTQSAIRLLNNTVWADIAVLTAGDALSLTTPGGAGSPCYQISGNTLSASPGQAARGSLSTTSYIEGFLVDLDTTVSTLNTVSSGIVTSTGTWALPPLAGSVCPAAL